MNPQEFLRDGDIAQALESAKSQVRSEPSNSRHRTLLFQLFIIVGEWEKALDQLDVVGRLDAEAMPMAQTYREAIRCEALRRAVLSGQRSPLMLGDPQPWVAWLIEALRLDANGQFAEAQQLRDSAFEQVEAVPGTLNGEPFDWIADADPRLGPLMEVIVNGRYYWVPFHQIRSINFESPADLRDLVWTPAFFTWVNGGEAAALIPSRYPDSEKQADSRLALSRMTTWLEVEGGGYRGLGQRQLCTDSGEFALLDIRTLELQSQPSAEPDSEAG